ncbi:Mediator of RNA polymerase II transcription subunit 14, partial [Ananas comosus]
MLRLHVLAKWCQQVPLVHYCQQLAATLSSHDTCFTQTADSLFYMHEGLQQARAPLFDVPSAVEVLLTNGYQRLPKCIEDLGMQSTLSADEQKPALKKLDTLVRSKLLEAVIPKEVSEVTISDGIATLRVDGEFKVLLTLGYRGHLTLWRILHLSCLQVQVLRQGRWKDAIRFELISDGHAGGNTAILQLGQDGELESTGLRTPGLKITYWLDLDKNNSDSSPFIKIEPGQDMQIKCLHSSFVLDPLTDKEANFSLDQSCIDVEKLLLKA